MLMFSIRNVLWSIVTEIREEAFLPTEKNSSFRAILRNRDAQKYEDSLESYEYFLKVRFFSSTLFSHLKPHWVLLCTQNKDNYLFLDEGWTASQTKWHMSQVLKDAQEPSRMGMLFPGTGSKIGKTSKTNEHVQEAGYETGRPVCLYMLLKLRISTPN